MPLITPEELIVAIDELPLLHMPLPVAVTVIVVPMHTAGDPEIGGPAGNTVITVVATQPEPRE